MAPVQQPMKAFMVWFQKQIQISPRKRGCHLVTSEILSQFDEISGIHIGFLQVFLMHTSASLTLNENADPDVRRDFEVAFDHLCPESLPFVHTCEGPDDMPAHIKASLMGCQLMLPIRDGRLELGTWQGVYLCEHRNAAGSRRLLLTAFGDSARH